MYPNTYGDSAYLRELRSFFFRVLGMMDVTHYGAIGDGRTDNYANLQVAIDDANRRGLHFIYVPFGRYLYRGKLLNMEHITFVGNPNAEIFNMITEEEIPVHQFGICPDSLSLRTNARFKIKNTFPSSAYIEVTDVDGNKFIVSETKLRNLFLRLPKGVPISTMYPTIKIVLMGEEEVEYFNVNRIPNEDLNLEIVPVWTTTRPSGFDVGVVENDEVVDSWLKPVNDFDFTIGEDGNNQGGSDQGGDNQGSESDSSNEVKVTFRNTGAKDATLKFTSNAGIVTTLDVAKDDGTGYIYIEKGTTLGDKYSSIEIYANDSKDSDFDDILNTIISSETTFNFSTYSIGGGSSDDSSSDGVWSQ